MPGMWLVDEAMQLIQAVHVELFVFLIAIATHLALFGNVRKVCSTTRTARKSKKVSVPPSRHSDDDANVTVYTPLYTVQQRGDPNAVRAAQLRNESVAVSPIARSIEALVRQKASSASMVEVLSAHLDEPTPLRTVQGVLQVLGKSIDAEVLKAIRDVLEARNLSIDEELGESLLQGYLTLRDFTNFKDLLKELATQNVLLTPGANILILKAAVKSNDMQWALQAFRKIKEHWKEEASTPSCAPQYLLLQVVELAAKQGSLKTLVPEVKHVKLPADVLNAFLTECLRSADKPLLQLAADNARGSGTVFNSSTYCLLVRAARTLSDAKRLFSEAISANQTSPELGIAVLELKGAFKEAELAQTVYKQFSAKELTADLLFAIVSVHAKRGEHGTVCDLHQKHLKGTEFEPKKQQVIIGSALACKRTTLIKQILNALNEVPKHVALIKAVGAQQGIKAAEAVFSLCPEQNSVLHNAVLDICVEQGDLEASERWMKTLGDKGMADVVTYNTLIKVHLNQHQFKRARSVIEQMRKAGFQPNLVTFNGIVDATLTASKGNMSEAWCILDEMEACGLKPNHITCSILLKSVQHSSNHSDVEWTIKVVNSIEDIDEILLSSVVEACVRVGRGDLLAGVLRRQRGKTGSGRVDVKGAHTYGSLIRGHGFINDLDGVWATWREMRSRQIIPTSITLGCMVEALVMNDDPDAGYKLIQEMLADRQCRCTVNAVIYCSVLKGLSHQKRMETLWPIYQEMLEKRMDFSIITYNTLVDACARCGHMDKVPILLKDMQKLGIEPNVITYSTILKGHCQAGDVELGFQVLQKMRQETKLLPDEIMYNSLLDGCARSVLYDSGIAVVEDMQKAGVRPSNFTLSILVKLASRAAKLDKAFELAQGLSQKYKFRLNGHVYTNLLQGCTCHQDYKRALSVLEWMLKERVRPEARTYVLLIRGCMAAGDCTSAAEVLRLACGLPCNLPQFSQFGESACASKISECASDTLRTLADRGHAEDLAGPILQDLKRLKPGIKVEPQVQLHITSRMIGTKGGRQVRSGQ